MTKLYTRCLRCGKKLKTLEAKQLGMGKICRQKTERTKRNKLF